MQSRELSPICAEIVSDRDVSSVSWLIEPDCLRGVSLKIEGGYRLSLKLLECELAPVPELSSIFPDRSLVMTASQPSPC